MKKSLFVLLAAALFAFSGLSVYAQQAGTGVKIQPAIVDQTVDPGQTINLTVQATNLSAQTKTYYFLVQDITGLTATGQPTFSSSSPELVGQFGLSSWITLSQKSVTLKAGEMKEVGYTVNVPKNAAPGGHFGGLFLTSEPPTVGANAATVGFQVGNIISLRISGTIVETAQVQEFSTDKSIYGSPDVTFTANIANQGNVLVRPRGPIDITDMWGKKVDSIIMNDEGSGIFPGTSRAFQASWHGTGFAFGRYEAVMSLAYGADVQKTISYSVAFWVLPLNIIVPVLLGIIVLILFIMFLTKWYVRRKLAQMGAPAGGSAYEKTPFAKLTFLTVIIVVLIALFIFALFFLFG